MTAGPAAGVQEEWLLVGRVAGAFGVSGEIKVEPLTDFPNRFSLLDRVYLGDERREHAVLSARRHKHVLLRLGDVATREAAQRLRGAAVWIPRSEAVPLPEGSFYLDDVIGLSVETDDGKILGQVADVLPTGANDVYLVNNGTRELLIPAIRDVVRSIDVPRGRIVIHVVEGLLD